ncbi:MAG: hypothetical protein ACLPSH_20280 [Vulcanimicrobiaceae bacterium]
MSGTQLLGPQAAKRGHEVEAHDRAVALHGLRADLMLRRGEPSGEEIRARGTAAIGVSACLYFGEQRTETPLGAALRAVHDLASLTSLAVCASWQLDAQIPRTRCAAACDVALH